MDTQSMTLTSLIGRMRTARVVVVGDLIAPTEGTVLVNGKPAEQARRDRDYGMVFQAPVLFDWRTVQGNIELPLELTGVPKAERVSKACNEVKGKLFLKPEALEDVLKTETADLQLACIVLAFAMLQPDDRQRLGEIYLGSVFHRAGRLVSRP